MPLPGSKRLQTITNKPGVTTISVEELFIYNTCYEICDKLLTELEKKIYVYVDLEKIGFLIKKKK